MKLLITSFFFIFVVLQYMYWFGESGFFATRLLQEDVKVQAKFNRKLAERNAQLTLEIQAIKHDDSVIETIARTDLGMIKPNEKFYLYVADE